MDPFKDEDSPENTTPTNEMIGRQVKRLQNAITLSELNFHVQPHVEDSTIGHRAIKVTEMAFANITGFLNRDYADMLMGFRAVIAEACQPNGSIYIFIFLFY